MATLGSRSTYHMGHAVKNAAEDARDKLMQLAKDVGLSAETTPIPDIFRKKYGMQAGNIVESTKVADARLEYTGKGYIDEAQRMGWLSRFFLTFLPL